MVWARLALGVLAAGLLGSCASRHKATVDDLADRTIQELTAYEQQLDNKINREKAFYRQQSANLMEMEGWSVLPKAGSAAAQKRGQAVKSAPVARLEESLAEKAAQEEKLMPLMEPLAEANRKFQEAQQRLVAARLKAAPLKKAAEEAAKANEGAQKALQADAANTELKKRAEAAAKDLEEKNTKAQAAAVELGKAEAAVTEPRQKQAAAQKAFDEAAKPFLTGGKTKVAAAPEDTAEGRVRRSLAYMRINLASNRDALATVDKLLAQGMPVTRAMVADYLNEGVTEDTAYVEKAVQSRQVLETGLNSSLTKLSSGKSNLAAAREALTEVRQKKKFLDRMEDLLRFGRKARDEFNEMAKTSP